MPLFDLQPTLRGELVELRPLRDADFLDLYDVAKDPLIWEQHPHKERYRLDVFTEFFRKALASRGALIATDVKTSKIIGSSRFYAYDPKKSEIEIGWTFLARAYWGGAYNKEMKSLMLMHAFKCADNVIFLIGLENVRSQKAIEKIGAVRTGTRMDAEGRPSFVYQITAASFI